jgi:hypothetical protein
LREALTERVDVRDQAPPIPPVDEHARLSSLRALESELDSRIGALRTRIANADSVVPMLEQGAELLRAGHAAQALAEFERVIAKVPGHRRARELMSEARAMLEAERQRQQLAAKLVQEARTALTIGAESLCLALLRRLETIPAAADVTETVVTLREQAAAAETAGEAVRRARSQADQAREQMADARVAAQAWAAAHYAATMWANAEARAAEAREALAGDTYDSARRLFDESTALYRHCEAAVREAFEIPAADSAVVNLDEPTPSSHASRTATTIQPKGKREQRSKRLRVAAGAVVILAGFVVLMLGVTRPRLKPSTPPSAPAAVPTTPLPEPTRGDQSQDETPPTTVANPPKVPERENVKAETPPEKSAQRASDTAREQQRSSSSGKRPQPGPSRSTKRPEPRVSDSTVGAAPLRPGSYVSPYRLVARASEATWLRVRTEDGRTIEEVIPPGEAREWVSNHPFVLTVGNAGGVTLELNGQKLPPLGGRGQVIGSLILPPPRP